MTRERIKNIQRILILIKEAKGGKKDERDG